MPEPLAEPAEILNHQKAQEWLTRLVIQIVFRAHMRVRNAGLDVEDWHRLASEVKRCLHQEHTAIIDEVTPLIEAAVATLNHTSDGIPQATLTALRRSRGALDQCRTKNSPV